MPPFRMILAAVTLIPAVHSAAAQQITGPATAIDGDSLDMTGTRIRLFGIDAPEGKQSCEREGTNWECGKQAADALRTAIASRSLSCLVRDQDVYGRMVSTCTVQRADIAYEMLESGLAVALPNADPAYHDAEARARSRRAGIWAGSFQTPAEWRAANPREGRMTPAGRNDRPQPGASRGLASKSPARTYQSNGICLIKGNLSRRMGEAIYYLPGMKYYAETRAEARFCTEAAALAAGFRRSRGG